MDKEKLPKKDYLSPTISIWEVEMEEALAAGSATISPTNVSNQVQEDWNDGTNETHDTPW